MVFGGFLKNPWVYDIFEGILMHTKHTTGGCQTLKSHVNAK